RWVLHDDLTVDVAVLQIDPLTFFQHLDHLLYPVEGLATEDLISKKGIGIGDEVFIMGLFFQHYGMKKNITIGRIGNLAAMPEEQVEVKNYGYIDAYLVESRSTGGLSGSPVFVHTGPVRGIVGEKTLYHSSGGEIYLIGLTHGHWDTVVAPLGLP